MAIMRITIEVFVPDDVSERELERIQARLVSGVGHTIMRYYEDIGYDTNEPAEAQERN